MENSENLNTGQRNLQKSDVHTGTLISWGPSIRNRVPCKKDLARKNPVFPTFFNFLWAKFLFYARVIM